MDGARRLARWTGLLLGAAVAAVGCAEGGAAVVPAAEDAPATSDAADAARPGADADDVSPPPDADEPDVPRARDVPTGDAGDAVDAEVADPNCHYDCFWSTYCERGVVRSNAVPYVPCRYWTGACPMEVSACPEGEVCQRAVQDKYADEPICGPPSAPGDPCEADDDCLEPASAVAADGTVKVTYLSCDPATSACVEGPAPTVSDYMQSCQRSGAKLATVYARYAASQDTCGGGACVMVPRVDEGCTAQGCTRFCTKDQDCPEGSACVEETALPGAGARPGGAPGPRACIPTGPGALLAALSCD